MLEDVLLAARREAVVLGHDELIPDHLLLGLLALNHPSSAVVTDRWGVLLPPLRTALAALLPATSPYAPPELTSASLSVLRRAVTLAGPRPLPGHLLLALLEHSAELLLLERTALSTPAARLELERLLRGHSSHPCRARRPHGSRLTHRTALRSRLGSMTLRGV